MERRAGFHSSFPLLLLLLLALALCSCLFKSPVRKAHILLSVGILCIITITKASAPDSGWAGTAGPAWPGGCWVTPRGRRDGPSSAALSASQRRGSGEELQFKGQTPSR